jgi:hypothetical protein
VSGIPARRALGQALWGARQLVEAARLVATDPRLRAAALPPTLLTLAGSAALAALVAEREGASWFQAAFAAFVAISSMPPTLLEPLWIRVGLRAREALGAPPGEQERPGERYLATVWREGRKALRQAALVAVGLAPAFLLVEALPLVGHGATLALGGAWAFYWVVIDAFEIPIELLPGKLGEGEPTWFERGLLAGAARSRLLFVLGWSGWLCGRLARPWRHQCRFTERHPAVALGLGAAAAAFLAVPVAGVFFRAVAITAATAVLVGAGDAVEPEGEARGAGRGPAPTGP